MAGAHRGGKVQDAVGLPLAEQVKQRLRMALQIDDAERLPSTHHPAGDRLPGADLPFSDRSRMPSACLWRSRSNSDCAWRFRLTMQSACPPPIIRLATASQVVISPFAGQCTWVRRIREKRGAGSATMG